MGETREFRGSTDNMALIVYESTYLYICKAALGAALDSPVWQIKRIDVTGDIQVVWADGNDNFDNVATDLATVELLSYS